MFHWLTHSCTVTNILSIITELARFTVAAGHYDAVTVKKTNVEGCKAGMDAFIIKYQLLGWHLAVFASPGMPAFFRTFFSFIL